MNRRIRVAIVDDDASVRRALERLLRCSGYAVDTYATAESFLHDSVSEGIDCALVDVRMTGETGLALTKLLRTAGIGVPVILMTGDVDAKLAVKAARCGAFALLSKPLHHTAIVEAIEAAVAGKESALAGRADSV